MPARAHAQKLIAIGGNPEKRELCPKGLSVFEAFRLKLAAIEDEVDDLRLLIRDARQQALAEIRETRLLLRQDAAHILALSLSQLDRLTKDGQIPVTYLDKRPRYSLTPMTVDEAVDELIAKVERDCGKLYTDDLHRRLRNRFCIDFGPRLMNSLTGPEIAAWIDAQPGKPRTRRNFHPLWLPSSNSPRSAGMSPTVN